MIDALGLGATLYVPATRPDLAAVLWGGRVPGLRSAVVCLEDAVLPRDAPAALANLSGLLRALAARAEGGPALFVRPRDPAMLERVLLMPGAERLHGFVLPKVGPDTLPAWLSLPMRAGHRIMPTLETPDAFDPWETRRLREQLLAVRDRVLALRIGGNDLLATLGLRRAPGRTAYDGPLGGLIGTLVGMFVPHGFALTAPVMERYDDPALLADEVRRDVEHGLYAKTAIHPGQVPVIHAALAVPSCRLAEARALLAADAPAVFALDGAMGEPATHRRWAERTLARADLFGVADPLPVARQA